MGRVTLSFDNGPHEDITPRVLDVLARHAVKASFFVVGRKTAEARAPPSGRNGARRRALDRQSFDDARIPAGGGPAT
jgi:peptidoglycan/xylan/chitin deacetylase (PgdA/CDA1 family)